MAGPIEELLTAIQTAWPEAVIRVGCEGPYICVGGWADIHVSDEEPGAWDVRFHEDPYDPRITSEASTPDTDDVVALLGLHSISYDQVKALCSSPAGAYKAITALRFTGHFGRWFDASDVADVIGDMLDEAADDQADRLRALDPNQIAMDLATLSGASPFNALWAPGRVIIRDAVLAAVGTSLRDQLAGRYLPGADTVVTDAAYVTACRMAPTSDGVEAAYETLADLLTVAAPFARGATS